MPVTAPLAQIASSAPSPEPNTPALPAAPIPPPKAPGPSVPEAPASPAGHRVEEFLGFCLGSEEYGVWIRAVKEIIRPLEITPIPRSPQDILGLISLRGTIVPIFNIRRRLGLPPHSTTSESRVVVCVLDCGPLGLLVDRVTEVFSADPELLEPPPVTLGEREAAFVTATLRYRQRLIGVLHLERLVAIEPPTAAQAIV
jgi:purine-binding chemotaxis protein CheW